jgi:DNA-binding transcriptional regulator PaaX
MNEIKLKRKDYKKPKDLISFLQEIAPSEKFSRSQLKRLVKDGAVEILTSDYKPKYKLNDPKSKVIAIDNKLVVIEKK